MYFCGVRITVQLLRFWDTSIYLHVMLFSKDTDVDFIHGAI